MLPLLAGCGAFNRSKRLDERVTLRKSDKIPYGTYIAFNELKYIFPEARIVVNEQPPSDYSSHLQGYSLNSGSNYPKALYVIITPEFNPDEKEYDALIRFVGAGNHVFISSF